MLLWLLLLHLAIHLLTATRHAPAPKNISSRPIDKNYVIKTIESCPDVGYFFKRETAPNNVNPGPCYLCFCQGQKTAICWRRENRRCNVESFHYHGLGKRDTRVRRSPAGLSDIFFRDAARDIFNRGTPQQCKPFEASFSEGCPPADWCIGCTVCDCDANGRWDCHILSFCPDKKPGKHLKKHKQHVNMPDMESLTAMKISNTTVPAHKFSTVKRVHKHKLQPKHAVENRAAPNARNIKKTGPKETTKRLKNKPLRYQKLAPKNATGRPKVINKNIATHKPINMGNRPKMQKVLKSNNETLRIAQEVVKRVMVAVRKKFNNELKNFTKLISPPKQAYKKITKRHVRKGTGQNNLKKYIIRNKRMATDNITVPRENPIVNISETTVTPNASSSLVPDVVDTATPTPTLNDREYYKYSIGVDHLTSYKPIVVNDEYQTETVVNLMSTERLKTIDDGNEITSFLDAIPEANDVKLKKWSVVKILKEEHDLNKGRHFGKNIMNTPIDNAKKIVHSKNVERKFVTKKFNIVKVLNSHMMAKDDTNQNQSTLQAIKSKISELQSSVSKLFRQFHMNNTLVNTNKHKRVGIVRHLKKLFSKIFSRKKTTKRINEFKVIETLCDTFGPCKVNKNDKLLLKSKLKELNDETLKILKTVQIIKGLLQLVNKPTTNKEHTQKANFGNDIQTLNNILRGSYVKYDDVPLSATQVTQIDYIKKNTKHFVISVSKFATVLNEIVNILIKNNNSNTVNFHRILRDTQNKKQGDPFKSFKNLLMRYNLVQNDFMKKMYRQLSEFENQIKEKKVSDNELNDDLNNSVAIETFSRNIITNLRQLKRVAQTSTSSGRVKRGATLKEDSIEYVLMVMEYLMKQNYPLDAAPVNDGIDLLIDAIRSAPDIKPKKKKVLAFTLATPFQPNYIQKSDSSDESSAVTVSPSTKNIKSRIDNRKHLAEQILDDDKENDERSQFDRKADDTTESVYFERADDTPNMNADIMIETISQSPVALQKTVKEVTEDSNTDNGFADVENSKNGQDLRDNDIKRFYDIGENNDVALPKTFPSNIDNEVVPLSDTTPVPKMLKTRKPKIDTDGANTRNYLDESIESNEKKFIIGENNEVTLPITLPSNIDNEVVPLSDTTPAPETMETREPKIVTEVANMRNYLDQSVESNEKKFIFDTKSQIDWIEENFGMDPNRLNIARADNTTASVNATNIDNTTIKPIKYDVSGITSEVVDKKGKESINAEEVMLRKQMELLNSLDYGTERSQFEDTESKDSNDDRYAIDSFPTYFV